MDFSSILNYCISLLTLTILELVLGVDNLVFLTIISNRLPQQLQKTARRLGLSLAIITRILLLALAYQLISWNKPFFSLFSFTISVRDLFLFFGGIFLLYKATEEIHNEFSERSKKKIGKRKTSRLWTVVIQIALLDIIFSFDSVITAIGLTEHFWLMVLAIIIALFGMIFVSEPLSNFIHKYPTIRMLAFSFLIMIGMVLVADGVHFHIPRAYLYFAVAFSLLVETLNILRKKIHNE